MRKILTLSLLSALTLGLDAQSLPTFSFGTSTRPQGDTFEVDRYGFVLNGRHLLPVMGEIHYARVPRQDWRREIRKMRAGGITVLSTYVFWIHHEMDEGHWDWAGQNDLHSFLEVCREEQMPVVLRIGPFCHGEVYQGGFPEWLVQKALADPGQYKIRSLAPGFMAAVQRLYSNIFAQASDMLWKHGGPIIGVQIENECRGPWAYYKALKEMAVSIGFDVPFYTRTGWPKLNGKEEFGQMLPLYGDYADGFWDRTLDDMPGGYRDAFVMKDDRVSAVIATETFGTNQDTHLEQQELQYPYLTCELGGGMMPSYHRRINISGREAQPLAICKLGSGSNLPGYYMYHGGSNPLYYPDGTAEPRTMAETQASPVTNYNDMPWVTYDFQSPLGEMGQLNATAYHQTRWLHQLLADWGEELAVMPVDSLSSHYARRGCFEFCNDYVRILHEEGQGYVRPVEMPFGGHKITADAQPFCQTGDTLWLLPIRGKKPLAWVDGKRLTLKEDKPVKVGDITLSLLSLPRAERAYKIDGTLRFAQHADGILYKNGQGIAEEYWHPVQEIAYTLLREADSPRTVSLGAQKVATMPGNADFEHAAVWALQLDGLLPAGENADDYFVQIDYAADCARVYADGRLVEDNFWNGKPMLVRLSALVGHRAELRILPLDKHYPIYLQEAQRQVLDQAPDGVLLRLEGIRLLQRATEDLH